MWLREPFVFSFSCILFQNATDTFTSTWHYAALTLEDRFGGMWWKYGLRMGQESGKCRKTWKFFSKSALKRQISRDSWDYNVSILYSSQGPVSCKEGWQILENSTVYIFHFSDKFCPRFRSLVFCCAADLENTTQPRASSPDRQTPASLRLLKTAWIWAREPQNFYTRAEKRPVRKGVITQGNISRYID